jgi:hypothetical protein
MQSGSVQSEHWIRIAQLTRISGFPATEISFDQNRRLLVGRGLRDSSHGGSRAAPRLPPGFERHVSQPAGVLLGDSHSPTLV